MISLGVCLEVLSFEIIWVREKRHLAKRLMVFVKNAASQLEMLSKYDSQMMKDDAMLSSIKWT